MTELPIVVNMTVDASRTEYDLTAESNLEEIELLNDTVIETGGSHVPVYEGPYTVDAGLSAVTLDTDGKRLTQDVTVNALTDNYISGNNITVDSSGKVSSFVSVSAGYSPNVFAQMFYKQLDTQARATITPTASEQTAVARNKYTLGAVKVRAISSPYADVSGVTATAGDVLSGKYFVDSNGVLTLGTGGGGMDAETKDALLECFEHVAWADSDGQIYYNNLLNALYPLQSISAVYTQSGDVYTDTPLNDLKSDLVVTATFEDGTTKTVTNYTLSGTLTVGTSTVTVTYFTETTTFNVTVSESRALPSEYQEVEWILSNNKAYINTGLTLTNDPVRIQTKIYTLSNSYNSNAFNVRRSTSAGGLAMALFNASNGSGLEFITGNGTGNFHVNSGLSNLNNQTVELEATLSGGNLNDAVGTLTTSLNGGTPTTVTNSGKSFDNSMAPLCLWGNMSIANVGAAFNGRIYYFKLWLNNVLRIDMVPCYRKADNVIGMYDLARNEFKTNSGAGSFTKGSDV